MIHNIYHPPPFDTKAVYYDQDRRL